ncbi:MAG: hypothetical protein SPG09_08270 [Lachnospiraceae bacterium]|nr:hypothetical protein [bacterium]MDY5517586.1 hypothetical protein [Lachnospiraceae bacterium]
MSQRVRDGSKRNRADRENMIQVSQNPIIEDDFHGFLHRNSEGAEQLLAEALADAMDRDLAGLPPREQLEQQHHFSKKFVRRMKRLESAVKDGQQTQTAGELPEKPQSGSGKLVDFRKSGAAAKRYGGLAAAFVCVIGLMAVVGVMTQSLRMGSKGTESIMEEAALPELAVDDAAEEATEEADADDAVAEDHVEESVTDDAAADNGTAAGAGAPESESGSPEESKGASSGAQSGEQEPLAPDWQEQLLIESAKADELVTWHFQIMYEDGSIGLTSEVVNPSHSTEAAPRQSLYASGVFEVYYEQSPDEWECVYRTKRTRDNYTATTNWDEWYALEELHMTQAGTYRLVRQVNRYRQVLQLTLEER